MRNKIKNFIITFWFKEDYNTPITGGRTYVSHTFKWQKLFNIIIFLLLLIVFYNFF